MGESVKVEAVLVGSLPTNCYIVTDEDAAGDSPACIVVDPGDEGDRIIEALGTRVPSHILLTHAHIDHVAGVGKIQARYPDALVVIGELDAAQALIAKSAHGVVVMQGEATLPNHIDLTVAGGDTIDCGGDLVFRVIHTPGHTPGGVCYWLESAGLLFSGDTLFRQAVGRTDFEGGSPQAMRESLRKLCVLPEETVVFPGHNEYSTIADELRNNMLLSRAYREVESNS